MWKMTRLLILKWFGSLALFSFHFHPGESAKKVETFSPDAEIHHPLIVQLTFNRNYTGVYFDPFDFTMYNGLAHTLEATGLALLLNKIRSEFGQILVPIHDINLENHLIPEIWARANQHQNLTLDLPPAQLTIQCPLSEMQGKVSSSQHHQLRHTLDKANSIFPGTVSTVLLNMNEATNKSLLQYIQFSRHFYSDDGNNRNYKLGIELDIKDCKGSSPSWEKILRYGFPEMVYFSQSQSTSSQLSSQGSVDEYLDILLKYFENCKRLVYNVNPNTEVGFMPTWPDTGVDGRVNYSNLVEFWRNINDWAEETRTHVFFLQAFDTPFHSDLTMKTNGWWRLVPNSSYLDPSGYIFQAKSTLLDPFKGHVDFNLTWLRENPKFDGALTGVIYNPVSLKQNNELLLSQNSVELFRHTDHIKQVSSQFSKVLFYSNGNDGTKAQLNMAKHDSVSSVVATLNSNQSLVERFKIMELILVINNQFNGTEVIRVANEANKIFPGTVKSIVFQASFNNLGQLENSIKLAKDSDELSLYKFGLEVPIEMCLAPKDDVFKLLRVAQIHMIYFSTVKIVSPDHIKLGFDRMFPHFTAMLANCKRKVNSLMGDDETTDVGFITGWPIVGEEDLNSLMQFVSFWEGMNDWAVRTNTTVIFSEAFDSPTGKGNKMSSVHHGWWKLIENGVFSGSGDGLIFQDKKEVALQYAEETLASETKHSTKFGFLEGSITALTLTLLMSLILYLRKRQSNNLSEAVIKEFLKGGQSKSSSDDDHDDHTPNKEMMSGPYNKADYEIPKKSFTFDESSLLGSGEFGIVCWGTIRKADDDDQVEEVAVKLIKDKRKPAGLRSLLFEIKILSYLGKHPNIVEMKGAYTAELRKSKVYLFLELCALGSLKTYLSKLKPTSLNDSIEVEEDNEFELEQVKLDESLTNDMLRWSGEISNGMEYISAKNIVHMDIATRNVLLTSDLRSKITDFGLSRRMYKYQSYVKKHQEPLPWRSMSPESLRKMEFTEKSDVWAFGVTLWEIFSLGDEPYPGLSWDVNFPHKLETGLRLAEPKYNCHSMYSVMLRSWHTKPERRPTFSELVRVLNQNPAIKSGESSADNSSLSPSESVAISPTTSYKAALLDSQQGQFKPEEDKKAAAGNNSPQRSTLATIQNILRKWNRRRRSLPWLTPSVLILICIISILILLLLYGPKYGAQSSPIQNVTNLSSHANNGSGVTRQGQGDKPTFTPILEHNQERQEIFHTGLIYSNESVTSLPLPIGDLEDSPPLHLAVAMGDEDLVKELIQNGTDNVDSLNKNKKFQPPLHLAASGARLTIIKFLIENGADVFVKDEGNLTFLHQLVSAGSTIKPSQLEDMTNYLIGKNYTALFSTPGGSAGSTPFHLAIANLEVNEATLSILHKNSVNFNTVDEEGCSLLCYAVRGNQSIHLLSNLIRLADWRNLDNRNRTLIHVAAEFGNLHALKFFISLGLDINAVDEFGNEPLHHVIAHGKLKVLEVVQHLVENGGGVNAKNELLQTPLHQVAYNNLDGEVNLKIIKHLIDNRADPFAENKMRSTFLHSLLEKNSSFRSSSQQFHDISEYLVGKGYSQLFDTHDGLYGNTPFQLAVKKLELQESTLSLLNESGVNFNAVDNNELSVLGYAIEGRRSAKFLANLIRFGADSKQSNKDGHGLLHTAAEFGNIEALKFLIKLGMNLNDTDNYGNTPLHNLAQSGKEAVLEVARFLVEHGADVNSINKALERPLYGTTQNGRIQNGVKISLIKYLIDSGADVLGGKDKYHPTFLHNLLTKNPDLTPVQFHDMTEYLIGKDYSKLFSVSNTDDGATPLLLAVKNMEVEEATLNLLNKTGVNFRAVDISGSSILSYALAGRRSTKLLSNLIEFGAELERRDNSNRTLLHTAVRFGNVGNLRFLIDLGRLDINAADKHNKTPLHHGAQYGKENALEMVRCLVEKGGDVNSTDEDMETPLFVATLNNQLDNEMVLKIVKYLIDEGSDVFAKEKKDNRTFLHQMVLPKRNLTSSQFHEISRYLVGKGYTKLFDVIGGSYKGTPFHWALLNMKVLEETLEVLAKGGVDLNSVDKIGDSVLSYAIYGHQSSHFISSLINLGANWRHLDVNNRSMLHDATRTGNVNAAKILLELGADVNGMDIFGDSPLHRVVKYGKVNVLETAELLIDYGAYSSFKNHEGNTPLKIAMERTNIKDKEAVLELLRRGT